MPLTKRDNAEYVIFVLCITLALAVAPFAVMRILEGAWLMAALDSAIVVSMIAVVSYVYKTRRHHHAAIVAACVFLCGTVITTHLQGVGQIHWAYPAFTVTFYLLAPKRALLATSAALLAIVPIIATNGTILEQVKVALSLAVNIIAAFAFANLTHSHRVELDRLMRIDPLTLAGNRRAMDLDLNRMMEEHRKYATPFTAIMIDIDHFKSINDSRGHLFGDQVIAQIAQVIASHMRDNEKLYRYGGEEFLVIARNIDINDASILAERLRKYVENTPIEDDIHLTISLGVARLAEQENIEAWLKRADKALYQAKKQGRNRVVLASTQKHNTPSVAQSA